MATKTAAQTQINTRVDDDLLGRLDDHCEREDRSRAWVLKEALAEFLDHRATSIPASTTEVAR